MPSETATPTSFAITWNEVATDPVRAAGGALVLALSLGTIVAGPGLSPGVSNELAAVTDTLFAGESIVDSQGRPTRRFQQVWQNTIEALVSVLTSQGASIDELEAIYAGINAAQATASAAAQQAQATAAAIDLAGSYTNPVGVLSAASNGTVTITAHQRIYSDGTAVDVNAGSVSGFAPGAAVTVYYQDPARAGGAVVYQGTTNAVAQAGDTHIAGQVTIPMEGSPDASGSGPTAPGWKVPGGFSPELIEYEMGT